MFYKLWGTVTGSVCYRNEWSSQCVHCPIFFLTQICWFLILNHLFFAYGRYLILLNSFHFYVCFLVADFHCRGDVQNMFLFWLILKPLRDCNRRHISSFKLMKLDWWQLFYFLQNQWLRSILVGFSMSLCRVTSVLLVNKAIIHPN